VILPEDAYSLWLDSDEADPEKLKPLLGPYAASEMIAYPVSTLVNDPSNDQVDCITPVK
jgi:putative SOS response-associated peptidase YedK